MELLGHHAYLQSPSCLLPAAMARWQRPPLAAGSSPWNLNIIITLYSASVMGLVLVLTCFLRSSGGTRARARSAFRRSISRGSAHSSQSSISPSPWQPGGKVQQRTAGQKHKVPGLVKPLGLLCQAYLVNRASNVLALFYFGCNLVAKLKQGYAWLHVSPGLG